MLMEIDPHFKNEGKHLTPLLKWIPGCICELSNKLAVIVV